MSRNVPEILETRYKRARGPAVLLITDPVDQQWLAACRAYRLALCAGTIPPNQKGPARDDFLPPPDADDRPQEMAA